MLRVYILFRGSPYFAVKINKFRGEPIWEGQCSSLEPRLSIPDFVSQPIFLQSCETKSGMESLGLRLEHYLISARKIVKWTVNLSVYIGLV